MRKTKKSVVWLVLLAFCMMMVFPVCGYAEEKPIEEPEAALVSKEGVVTEQELPGDDEEKPVAAEDINISEEFLDVNFRNAVTDWLELPRGSAFTEEDIVNAMKRNGYSLNVSGLEISDLSGLEYFRGLMFLECNENYLRELPELPERLIMLYCSDNQLTELPELPKSLVVLYCDWNRLTKLPELPEGLAILGCRGNLLTEIPELPEELNVLRCGWNQLAELPELPEGLTRLLCSSNQLTKIPKLPAGLTELWCDNNQLNELPELPESLTDLCCGANQLIELPELPDGLINLECYLNRLTGLPKLPNRLVRLQCSDSQLTELPGLPERLELLSCSFNCLAELPELPEGLTWLICRGARLTELPKLPDSLEVLRCDKNQLTVLPELPKGLEVLECELNYINVWEGYSEDAIGAFPEMVPQLRLFLENTIELELLPGSSERLQVKIKGSTDGAYWEEKLKTKKWTWRGGWVNPFNLDWNSSNEGVATVSADGLVTGHAPGECTVTGRYLGISGEFTTVSIPVFVNQQPETEEPIEEEPKEPEESEETEAPTEPVEPEDIEGSEDTDKQEYADKPKDTEEPKRVKEDTGINGKKLPRTGGFALPCILAGIALTAAGLHLRRPNK